jgi:HEPN domain-containing protein
VIGFHAQQAVEKALKSVVVALGLEIPRSHDLVLLIRLLDLAGGSLPDVVLDAGWLNPWAVSMRYDEVESALDRDRAVQVADEVLRWAQQAVASRRT